MNSYGRSISGVSEGLLALAGVVVGVLATGLVNWQLTGRVERDTRRRWLLGERLAAYTQFAAAARADLRGQQNRWWTRTESGRTSSRYQEAKDESYRVRADAWAAYSRLKLVAHDAVIGEVARNVLQLSGTVHDASDEIEMNSKADEVRQRIEDFASTAHIQVD